MVSLFAEGLIDEAVLLRIVTSKTELIPGVVVSGKGKTYIQQRARGLNRSAAGSPIIALADLDREDPCPPQVLRIWLNDAARLENFIVRFAVLEVEAWLLADAAGLSEFLRVPVARVPTLVETLEDPKQQMISLARRSSSRAIREALVPDPKSRATVGPNYNAQLVSFVRNSWDIDRASAASQSLDRAVRRIVELADRVRG